MSRDLFHLQPHFSAILGREPGIQPPVCTERSVLEGAGALPSSSDALLDDLRIANLTRHLVDGDLADRWAFGVAVGEALRRSGR